MSAISGFLVVALAIVADAGMMGPPPGIGGPGGPPGAFPGAAGPPPFVQSIIASKGKPFAGGPPGAAGGAGAFPGAAGPPPFVQSIIASKGKPFAGGPPAAAPAPAYEPAPVDLGPPAYIQSLMAAKAATAYPFMPPTISMGPPPFVQQLIAAKNAAAAQAAAEADALAQQYAPQPSLAGPQTAPPPTHPSLNATRPLGPPPFVQIIISQKGIPAATGPTATNPSVGNQEFNFPYAGGQGATNTSNKATAPATGKPPTTGADAPPPDWIQQLLDAQMAKNAAAKAKAAMPPWLTQAAAEGNTSGQPGMQRRDAAGVEGVSQQPQGPVAPGFSTTPFTSPYGYPPVASPYPGYPFMPMFPPIPMWKLG